MHHTIMIQKSSKLSTTEALCPEEEQEGTDQLKTHKDFPILSSEADPASEDMADLQVHQDPSWEQQVEEADTQVQHKTQQIHL